jgi:hypothetical protein
MEVDLVLTGRGPLRSDRRSAWFRLVFVIIYVTLSRDIVILVAILH